MLRLAIHLFAVLILQLDFLSIQLCWHQEIFSLIVETPQQVELLPAR